MRINAISMLAVVAHLTLPGIISQNARAAATNKIRLLRTFKSPEAHKVRWSGDGRYLATAASIDFPGPGEVRLWDARNGRLIRKLRLQYEVPDIAFSPDGRLLAIACNGDIQIRRASTCRIVRVLHEPNQLAGSVTFSADGKSLIAGSGMYEDGTTADTYLWNLQTGKLVFRLPMSNGISFQYFVPHEKRVIAVFTASDQTESSSSELKAWDTRNGKLIYRKAALYTTCIAASPDGKTLATGTFTPAKKGEIRLWNTVDGVNSRSIQHNRGITNLAYSPDGRVRVSEDIDGLVRIADAKNGQVTLAIHVPHHGGHNGLAFSPDSHQLAMLNAGVVRIWRLN